MQYLTYSNYLIVVLIINFILILNNSSCKRLSKNFYQINNNSSDECKFDDKIYKSEGNESDWIHLIAEQRFFGYSKPKHSCIAALINHNHVIVKEGCGCPKEKGVPNRNLHIERYNEKSDLLKYGYHIIDNVFRWGDNEYEILRFDPNNIYSNYSIKFEKIKIKPILLPTDEYDRIEDGELLTVFLIDYHGDTNVVNKNSTLVRILSRENCVNKLSKDGKYPAYENELLENDFCVEPHNNIDLCEYSSDYNFRIYTRKLSDNSFKLIGFQRRCFNLHPIVTQISQSVDFIYRIIEETDVDLSGTCLSATVENQPES